MRTRGLHKDGQEVLGHYIPLDIEVIDTDPETLQLTFLLSTRAAVKALLEALAAPGDTIQTNRATWHTQDDVTGVTHTFTGACLTVEVTSEPGAPWVTVHLCLTLTGA